MDFVQMSRRESLDCRPNVWNAEVLLGRGANGGFGALSAYAEIDLPVSVVRDSRYRPFQTGMPAARARLA